MIADKLKAYLVAGQEYEFIRGTYSAPKGTRFKVYGVRWSCERGGTREGWVVSIQEGILALDRSTNEGLYARPEDYLAVVGVFDIKTEKRKAMYSTQWSF